MTRSLVLLACVVGVASAGVGPVSTAAAQTPLPAGTVAGTISSAAVPSGAGPTYTGATSNAAATPDTGTIALNSARTVINMTTLNLTTEDTLNIVGAADTDTIVIRVNNGVAQIDGTVVSNSTVWIVSAGGMSFGPQSDIITPSLLSTTANITDTDFFNGNALFSDAAESINVAEGADMQGSGAFAFVGQHVSSGAAVSGDLTDVVYGSAEDFQLTFASVGLGLNRLDITTPSSVQTGVELHGATGGAVSVASRSSGGDASIIVEDVETHGPVASGKGEIVISAGGGVARDGLGRMKPLPSPGAPAQGVLMGNGPDGEPAVLSSGDVHVAASGRINAIDPVLAPVGNVIMDAAGQLRIGAQVSAPTGVSGGTPVGLVALSTGSQFVNDGGAAAVSASKWVVYAPGPSDIVGGLDSNNTAFWGSNIGNRPPASVTGDRYVFGTSPTLTFSSVDTQKKYGVDLTGQLTYNVTGFHAGVTGLFDADTASTAFSGSPAVTSAGAPAKAMVPRSPYGISIASGSLNNLAGYTFAYYSAGSLDVVSCALDANCGDAAEPAFTFGPVGWQTVNVTPTVVADGGYSGIYSLACTLNGASATLTNLVDDDYDPWSGDFSEVGEGRHSVACDAVDGAANSGSGSGAVLVDKTAPVAAVVGPVPDYKEGTDDWYRDSVTLSFAANDPVLADGEAGSGVDEDSLDDDVTFSTTGTHVASDSSVADIAGNSTSASRTVKVDATDPTLSVECPETVYLNGTAEVTVEALDVGSGLASDPSRSATVDSSEPGPQTVTVTATDNVGNATAKSCTTTVVYKFGGYRQPINADGSSVFKLGSTVPAKFALTDANDVPVDDAVARLSVVKMNNTVEGDAFEPTSTAAATTGNLFRYDGAQYIYNLGTKPLSKGTWRLKALLDDGTTHTVQIALR